jgi:hypothetical protein
MQVYDLICINCQHFREIEGGCAAFPDGIPSVIIEENEHSEPLPDQENEIVFTPIEN